ncbi:MAG: single-stranded-DNA-specific exonuclease RecJ [Spirochaetaceae bacterium]|nr:MAG: single-stranded-DNA-specific exonuclease RecJ [Spirochaetaceae bacterium]
MNWHKQEIAPDEVRDLHARYGLDLLPAAILARRGITTPGEIKYYLENDLRYLHNPFLFEEMDDAVERLTAAIAEQEKVLVFGDRDVDGMTSIAILVSTFRELGLDVTWGLPLGDDPYGLTIDVVERFAADDGTLIVTVDCGTTNTVEIARAVELGLDTIVLDHHNPQDELPEAVAFINPKAPESSYPFAGICGCTIAMKLREALFFAKTEFFNETICLMNCRPGNDTVVIEAVKLRNLVELDRIQEHLVPDIVDATDTRLFRFLANEQILVYDAPMQVELLKRAFGPSTEINVLDIAPQVWKQFPGIEGRSLLKLRDGSKLAVYADGPPGEIDALIHVFEAYVTKHEAWVAEKVRDVLDLVALGTTADMMPLRNENRILVRAGIAEIQKGKRRGLRRLLEKQNLWGKTLSTRDLGWHLTPVLNAAGRMGEPDKAVRLLLSELPDEQDELSDQIIELNKRRKKIGDEAWKRIMPKARDSFLSLAERFVIVHDNAVHRGITGIIAGRLTRFFNAPAAVITSQDGRAVGSIRTVRGFGATTFLKQFEDVFDDWGGHDAAGGFHFPVERIGDVTGRMSLAAKDIVLTALEDEKITVDAELPWEFFNPNLESVVRLFEPYGQENAPLVFLVRGVKVSRLDLIGKTSEHVKMVLDAAEYRWPAVFWNAAERVKTDFTVGDTLDVVFQFTKNFFQNTESVQLVVLDVKKAGPREVVRDR